jgi:hypothetical protein
MGQYDGGAAPVDSSGWQRPTSHRPGEPGPAPMERDEKTGTMKRSVTPDPYKNGGNGHTLRNFGHQPGQN